MTKNRSREVMFR